METNNVETMEAMETTETMDSALHGTFPWGSDDATDLIIKDMSAPNTGKGMGSVKSGLIGAGIGAVSTALVMGIVGFFRYRKMVKAMEQEEQENNGDASNDEEQNEE